MHNNLAHARAFTFIAAVSMYRFADSENKNRVSARSRDGCLCFAGNVCRL